jgi:putative ABC transport system permease protein
MTELLGVPTKQLTLVLSGVFAAGTLILVFLAARNRTSFRMAVRNASRRPTQTTLILLGLMLATVLFSAAFTTGNTLTNSLRAQALENIGRVDVVVKAEKPESSGGVAFGPGAGGPPAPDVRERYFDESLVGKIRDRLSGVESVAGVAPLAKESVPVRSPETDLSEPQVDVLGMDANFMQGFDRLRTASGMPLALGDLKDNEVYVSAQATEGLGIGVGDKVKVSLVRPPSNRESEQPPSESQSKQRLGTAQGRSSGPETRMPPAGVQSRERPQGPTEDGRLALSKVEARPVEVRPAEAKSEERPPEFVVAGIYESGANPASNTSMVMTLAELQRHTGDVGKVNEILVTHGGPAVEGGEHTSKTLDKIRHVLSVNSLEADPVKKDAIEAADTRGEIFSTLFVLFGQFSVAAGMLLIFLIFVMLAAERKKELGVARAVGMQRSHLISTFVFEGTLYALAASTMGSVAGVGVGWVMVRLLGKEFAGGEGDLRIAFASSPENVVLAFCMGMVLTFAVVLISSWRVSRLNVVRAIRDLPEPDRKGRTVWGVLVAVSLLLAGSVAFWQGFATETMAFYLGGISLVARVLGLPDRVAFTVSGLVLLALWLVPARITAPAGMAKGPEMFFVSGIAIVVAGVWIVIFNADVLLWVVVAIFGRIRGLPPVLKTAVKYPTQSLFRTGMTLAMFMLVVFTLTAMNFIQAAMSAAFEDTQELSGGYEVQANASYAAPIPDVDAAIEDADGIRSGDVRAVGEVSNLPAEVKQRGTNRDPKSLYIQGVDGGYSDSVDYGFETTARGYGSARQVWKALQTEKDTALISSDLTPSRNVSTFGSSVAAPVKLTGFYAEDKYLPEDLYLRVEDPDSGETSDLRVIGVLGSSASFAGDIVTSQDALEGLTGRSVAPQTYYFDLGSRVDAATISKTLERDFAKNGLQTQVTAEVIRDNDATRRIVFLLLRGFMSLGLVVGIAALGVIAARSVVERRQQIGMMRALGFQRGQVRLVFLIESSFIALLGIGVGVALGLGFSGTLIDNISQNIPGLDYHVPWGALLLVVVVGYAASLLTTFLPARQASKVYPAEALRYE